MTLHTILANLAFLMSGVKISIEIPLPQLKLFKSFTQCLFNPLCTGTLKNRSNCAVFALKLALGAMTQDLF